MDLSEFAELNRSLDEPFMILPRTGIQSWFRFRNELCPVQNPFDKWWTHSPYHGAVTIVRRLERLHVRRNECRCHSNEEACGAGWAGGGGGGGGGPGGGHCAAPATEGPTSGGGGRPISLRVNAASRSNRRRSALSRRSGLGLDAGEFLCRPHPHSVPFLFFSAIWAVFLKFHQSAVLIFFNLVIST